MIRRILALLLLSLPSFAAIALVSHTAAGSTGSNTVTTPAISTTGANLICVYISYDTGTGSLTDSAGNTYTALTNHGALWPQRGVIFYALNQTTSATHTWTFTGNGQSPGVVVAAFSGVAGFLSENGNTITTAASTIQTGAVSPTITGSLVITGLAWDLAGATPSINSSFAITDSVAFSSTNHYAASMAYLITNTTANPTWTISASSADGLGSPIAAFTPKKAGPGLFPFVVQ